jgi:hypothetical protein
MEPLCDTAPDKILAPESVAALIRFFQLLDQWDREAGHNAEIM